MSGHKLVVRFASGRVAKGITADFSPSRPMFHLLPSRNAAGDTPEYVCIDHCKALFFVREYDGNKDYRDVSTAGAAPSGARNIRVACTDGEVLVGATWGYDPSRQGFFLFPADPRSNNQRSYIVARAVRNVEFL